jgi:hypothetical protein
MLSQYEFEKEHRVLLAQLNGRLSEESLRPLNSAGEKYWAATTPRVEIVDCSGVTECAISSDRMRGLARQPLTPGAANARVVIVPTVHSFGLARMYQMMAERTRPRTTVVRTMNEGLKALGITSPNFEPLT